MRLSYPRSNLYCVQVQEEEKKSLEVQFEAHYARKGKIDAAQKELLTKLKDIKIDIDEFGTKRDAIQVWMACLPGLRRMLTSFNKAEAEKAAEKRTQYRSNVVHYERKLADEAARVEQTEANAEGLQADFQASPIAVNSAPAV